MKNSGMKWEEEYQQLLLSHLVNFLAISTSSRKNDM